MFAELIGRLTRHDTTTLYRRGAKYIFGKAYDMKRHERAVLYRAETGEPSTRGEA